MKERSWLNLVETFFRGSSRAKGRLIYRELRLRGKGVTQQQIAAIVSSKTGEPTTREHVATTWRRFRQRTDVLHWVLDEQPSEELPDRAGDEDVFAYVDMRWGVAEKDRPTIRHLAALARAARSDQDPMLCWAVFARRVVNEHTAVVEACRAIQEELHALGCSIDARTEQRLAKAGSWMGRQREALRQAANIAKTAQTGFLVSPCWYLVVLCGRSKSDVCRILNPLAQEYRSVERIVEAILVPEPV